MNLVARLGMRRNLCSSRNFFSSGLKLTPRNFRTSFGVCRLIYVVAESFRAGLTCRAFQRRNFTEDLQFHVRKAQHREICGRALPA